MDKYQYELKTLELMENQQVYVEIQDKQSSHKSFTKLNEKYLKMFMDLELLKNTELRIILAKENRHSKIYGVLKDHKNDMPMRPVINTINTPFYHIAGLLSEIFTKFKETHKYNVSSGIDFKNILKQAPFSDQFVLCTADVKSMFTNISKSMAKNAIEIRYDKIKLILPVPMEELVKIVNIVAFYSSEIQYGDKLFKQKIGIKMGSRLSY